MVPRLSPGEAAYRLVRRRILANELAPGAPVTELGLAHALGCSQGPVREALLRLQEDGLVQRAGRRGTVVTPLAAAEAAEMLAVRRLIETRAAAHAAGRADAADRARLEGLYQAMEAAGAAGDEQHLLERDVEFHLALFDLAGLPALRQLLVRAMLHSHRWKVWAPANRRSLASSAARHQPILEALAAGDGAALAAALGHHLDTIVETETSDRENRTA